VGQLCIWKVDIGGMVHDGVCEAFEGLHSEGRSQMRLE
jgi:hypothetical protein